MKLFSCLLLVCSLSISLTSYAIETVDLDDISITASRSAVALNATGSAVTVITEQDIQNSQLIYLADVLRAVPGVAVSNSGGFTQLRMRGSESDHVLVIIDGVEINPGSGDGVNFAHILTSDVERIEILRGSQSVLWGSDAIGGVIAITTRSGTGDEKSLKLRIQEGSFNSSSYSANLNAGTDSASYALNISRIDSGGFSSADDDRFSYTLPDGSTISQGGSGSEKDAYSNRTISASMRHAFNDRWREETSVRETNYILNSDSFSGGAGAVDSSIPRTGSIARYGQHTIHYTQLGGRLQQQLKVSKNIVRSKYVSRFGNSSSRSQKTQHSYQLNYFLPQFDDSDATHSVTLALEREDISNDSSFSAFHENYSSSLIAEYRFELEENFSSAVAFRHERNNIFNNANIGHLNFSYAPNLELRWHASLGTAVKNPTLGELFGSSSTYVGNANLRPEQSESLDFGMQWLLSLQQVLDVTLFSLRIENQIIGSGNTSRNIEGRTNTRGVELSYNDNFLKDLAMNFNLTVQKGEDAKGDDLVRRPEVIAGVNATLHSFANLLTTTLSINYTASQTDDYFDTAYNRFPVTVRSYTVANLAARFKLSKQTDITSRIDNIFNETYQEVIGYGTSARAFYMGLRIKL